jgi:cytidylate kinase
LIGRGESVVEADILADLVARDQRDAPNMRIAPDAIRIDTTQFDVGQAVAAALAALRNRLS